MGSTHDRRFPHLYPAGSSLPGMSACDQKHVWRVGEAVTRRTGLRCFYNARLGKLTWCLHGAADGGPLGVPMIANGRVRRYEDHEIDDMVRWIGMGRLSRAQKDRIAAGREASEKSEAEQAQGRFSDGNRKNATDMAGFLDRRRRGVATVISA